MKNNKFLNLEKSRVIFHGSSIAFDAANLEIWLGLINHLKIVVYKEEFSYRGLFDFIKKEEVDIFFLTTSLFHGLVNEDVHELKSLKYLLTGGEELSIEVARKIKDALPEVRIMNLYGPTENGTVSTYFDLDCLMPYHEKVPIGKAISGTSVYLFDGNQEIQKTNASTGEIFVGGLGLAISYFNKDKETSKKFVYKDINGDVIGYRESVTTQTETYILIMTSILTVIFGYNGIKTLVYDILVNLPILGNYFALHPLRWTVALWVILLLAIGYLNFNRYRAT